MISHRPRRLGPFLLAAAALGAFTGPGAALADGPGYGGTADALTVQWRPHAAAGDGLAVYALGFKGGSPVNLRVGAAAERTVVADAAGALRVLVVSAAATPAPAPTPDTTVLPVTDGSTDRLSSGTSVLAVGTTPAGAMRTLVGSVPPEQARPGHSGPGVVGRRRRGARRRGVPVPPPRPRHGDRRRRAPAAPRLSRTRGAR
nr:hypothetical protein GCM10020092_066190 [Actinoplanes digitatis]